MSRLKETYLNEIKDAMQKKFEYKNEMQIPKLDKIVINMGVGEAKENRKVLDTAVKDLETEGKLITNVLDDSQKLEFRKAVQPMYDKYQKQFGQELFDLCEKYNK